MLSLRLEKLKSIDFWSLENINKIPFIPSQPTSEQIALGGEDFRIMRPSIRVTFCMMEMVPVGTVQ